MSCKLPEKFLDHYHAMRSASPQESSYVEYIHDHFPSLIVPDEHSSREGLLKPALLTVSTLAHSTVEKIQRFDAAVDQQASTTPKPDVIKDKRLYVNYHR